MKPILACGAGLADWEVGHLQIEEAFSLEQVRNQSQRHLRMIKMLQNNAKGSRIEVLLGKMAILQRLRIYRSPSVWAARRAASEERSIAMAVVS